MRRTIPSACSPYLGLGTLILVMRLSDNNPKEHPTFQIKMGEHFWDEEKRTR